MSKNSFELSYRQKIVSWLLRVGVSFTFLYAAYSGYVSPSMWVGYVPDLPVPIDSSVLLQLWGAFEVLFALWLLSGWRIYYPALVLAFVTGLLMVFNLSQFSILFRDVTIIFASLALIVLHYPYNLRQSKSR